MAPPNCASVIDPDADGFVHWLVVGLPAEAGLVGGGEPTSVTGAPRRSTRSGIPAGAAHAPPGDGPHTYDFTLHLLDQATRAPRRHADERAAHRRRRGDGETATFTGTYERA